ncbi:MAG TPA: hypothetical protein VMX58_08705 [Patescibacteria group bacterium]|nr:hypothetical protein [Patescibacteria group bacterium]
MRSLPLLTILLVLLAGCEERATAPFTPPGGEPYVIIEQPAAVPGTARYSEVIRFRWRSGPPTPPDSVRFLWSAIIDTTGAYNPGFDILADINEHGERYNGWWSHWIPYDAPDDSGSSTIIGDDEELVSGTYYLFAVQAIDRYGTVTGTFGADTNARLFRVQRSRGALLTIFEPLLGGFKFIGVIQNPVQSGVPSGTPLGFRWQADASGYGGEVAGYRYGWDVPDTDAWTTPYRIDNTTALEAVFNAGTHTLTVEAVDLSGAVTRAVIVIETVLFPMERNLLWIDDFPGGTVQSPLYEMPSEANHDAFWLATCGRAAGFEPARDVYDCREHLDTPPGIGTIGLYKNVIWTYSSSSDAWQSIVHFTPESRIGQGGQQQVNYLPIFLVKGGHLWTAGRADRGGGLAAVLEPAARSFPTHLACEITGNRDGCDGDRSGVRSMPYRDYCVSMIDKIDGVIRRDPAMPYRSIRHYDVMAYAYKDGTDIVTARHAGLPGRLDLRDEVTSPGRYFDPDSLDGLGGFPYVEVYDPAYWMNEKSLPHQICFHPIYRMRARGGASALDREAVALWVTPYEEIVPAVKSGVAVAAPSVHFGFPLWFFTPGATDSITTVIFSEWGILHDE